MTIFKMMLALQQSARHLKDYANKPIDKIELKNGVLYIDFKDQSKINFKIDQTTNVN